MEEHSVAADATLKKLEAAATQSVAMEATLKDRTVLQAMSRAEHALARRIGVWKQIRQIEVPGPEESPLPVLDPRVLPACLDDIEALLRNKPERPDWERFLGLYELRAWVARRVSPAERLPRQLALALLRRMDNATISVSQRRFISSGPVAILQQELRRHTADAVDGARLLAHLERYEESGVASDSRLLAEDCRCLALSPRGLSPPGHGREPALSQRQPADCHQRRSVQSPDPRTETGIRTGERLRAGTSGAGTERHVHGGAGAADARSGPGAAGLGSDGTSVVVDRFHAGPATFIDNGNSTYTATKPVEIDLHGIRLGRTNVEVNHESTLRGVNTDYDGVLC